MKHDTTLIRCVCASAPCSTTLVFISGARIDSIFLPGTWLWKSSKDMEWSGMPTPCCSCQQNSLRPPPHKRTNRTERTMADQVVGAWISEKWEEPCGTWHIPDSAPSGKAYVETMPPLTAVSAVWDCALLCSHEDCTVQQHLRYFDWFHKTCQF